MKPLLVFLISILFLTGCQSPPAFVDNGNPGQIQAVVFYDHNRNGTMDSDETGAEIELWLSQDTSCPPTNRDVIVRVNTGENGSALFGNLKPGKYCVAPGGNFSMTTKMTRDVYVSSDATTTVTFGLVRE
jgi:uncharacterized protein (DUF2141 family)